MASSPLALARSAHEVAFTALVAWLKADQGLSRTVRTWRLWDGDKATDPLPTSVSQLPWVRLTPAPGPISRFTIGVETWLAPLVVTVETAVPGSNATDSMRLWDAVFDRLMDWDPRLGGISDLVPEAVAESINDSDYTIAKGTIRLEIYVNA